MVIGLELPHTDLQTLDLNPPITLMAIVREASHSRRCFPGLDMCQINLVEHALMY